MTSPTQTVVGKGIPNPLIVKGLLKILRDLISLFSLKFLTNSRAWNGETSKKVVIVSSVKLLQIKCGTLILYLWHTPLLS